LSFLIFLFSLSCSGSGWVDNSVVKKPDPYVVDDNGGQDPLLSENDSKKVDTRKVPVLREPDEQGYSLVVIEEKEELLEGKRVTRKAPDPEKDLSLHQQKEGGTTADDREILVKSNQPSNTEGGKKPVYYSAQSMTREEKWIKRLGRKDVMITLRGAVRVKSGSLVFTSARGSLLGAQQQVLVIDTPLKIIDSANRVTLTAGYGEYLKFHDRAFFERTPVLVKQEKENNSETVVHADRMERDFSGRITNAYGHVKIRNGGITAFSASAVYYESQEKIVLEGSPVIYEKGNIYLARKMVLYTKERRFVMENDVVIYHTHRKEGGEVVRTVLESDQGVYREGKQIPYGKEVELASFDGHFVKIDRDDSATLARRVIFRGEQINQLEFFSDITILDKENRTLLFGEYGNYEEKTAKIRFTHVLEDGKKKRPYAVFRNENDVVLGVMEAELLERDNHINYIYARGDVWFDMYERELTAAQTPRVETTMRCQWAEMYEDTNKISLFGKPYIATFTDKIYAGRMVVDLDKHSIELLDKIEGDLGIEDLNDLGGAKFTRVPALFD